MDMLGIFGQVAIVIKASCNKIWGKDMVHIMLPMALLYIQENGIIIKKQDAAQYFDFKLRLNLIYISVYL